jgi:hypothetical protein
MGSAGEKDEVGCSRTLIQKGSKEVVCMLRDLGAVIHILIACGFTLHGKETTDHEDDSPNNASGNVFSHGPKKRKLAFESPTLRSKLKTATVPPLRLI